MDLIYESHSCRTMQNLVNACLLFGVCSIIDGKVEAAEIIHGYELMFGYSEVV